MPCGVPLLKHILALPGQTVCRSGRTIIVDGRTVGRALARDHAGRNLPTWVGCRIVAEDEVFLMNWRSEYSFDGRYFGRSPSFDDRRPRRSPLDPEGQLTVSMPVKKNAALTGSRRFAAFSFPAVFSVATRHKSCRLWFDWQFCSCAFAAVVMFVCGNAPHAEPIAAGPSGSVAPTDSVAAFVEEASRRFAISSSWIRAVMQAESGGDVRALSAQGAMGLMQIMPDTWAELRRRYGLGTDPYDPHDNITAGAAYLREMHDRYGEPGFLAAYNAGPDRYEEHLATGRPLPSETVSYMAVVASLVDISNGEGNVSSTLSDAPSWSSSPLFVVRANAASSSSRSSSGAPMQPGRSAEQSNECSTHAALQRAIRQHAPAGRHRDDLHRAASRASGLWDASEDRRLAAEEPNHRTAR